MCMACEYVLDEVGIIINVGKVRRLDSQRGELSLRAYKEFGSVPVQVCSCEQKFYFWMSASLHVQGL